MPFVVGTAGHVDHGKTALVGALTGQDTDRLAEEKARGISIDLGFAHLDLPGVGRVGVVDVPGHERFIRNMLAGVHGIDLVLLVVAADDGVMPQTEEHVDILHVLGVRCGVVALTKMDLVDPARLDAVREEIAILTADTSLEGTPIVPVSSTTGAGLDDLRRTLAAQLARPVAPAAPGYFRLPVDRAFVMHGHGVVVTGTAMAGEVRVGDKLRILPGSHAARVRTLEVHGVGVPDAGRGQRVALNLVGVERVDVRRGHVLADERIARDTNRIDALVEVRPGARQPLRHHGRVRIHLGTTEVAGKIVLLDGRAELPPRSSGWVQVVLADPVVALRGDRFVLRDETSRWTLGGGQVVNPFAPKHRRREPGLLEGLAVLRGDDLSAAAVVLLEQPSAFTVDADRLAQALGRRVEDVVGALSGMAGVLPVPDAVAPEAYTTSTKWTQLRDAVRAAVDAFHAAQPLLPGADTESLRTQLPWDVSPRVFRWAVDRLVSAGVVVRGDGVLRAAGHAVALGGEQRLLADRLETLIAAGRFTPPDLRQLEASMGVERRRLVDLLAVLEGEGRAIRVAPDLYFSRAAADAAQALVREHCQAHGTITAGAFRDLIGASRKIAIPFLDWCDRTGFTLRLGDVRKLRR